MAVYSVKVRCRQGVGDSVVAALGVEPLMRECIMCRPQGVIIMTKAMLRDQPRDAQVKKDQQTWWNGRWYLFAKKKTATFGGRIMSM